MSLTMKATAEAKSPFIIKEIITESMIKCSQSFLSNFKSKRIFTRIYNNFMQSEG